MRGMIAWLAMRYQRESLTALAQRFNRDLSALIFAALNIELEY